MIAELELNVLTDPSVSQSQELYILTSELSLLKSTISPVVGLVSSLRDHKKSFSGASKAFKGVEVSEVTKTYLGDVDDHLLLLLEVSGFPSIYRSWESGVFANPAIDTECRDHEKGR